MKCPFCTQDRMVEVEAGGVHVDRCGGCQGLFFEAGELATYTNNPELEYQTRELARSLPGESPRRCPACAGDMRPLPRTAGHFDVCHDCGGFALDAVAVVALATMTVAAVEAGKPLWERFAQSLDSGAEEVVGAAVDVGAEVVVGISDGVSARGHADIGDIGDIGDVGDVGEAASVVGVLGTLDASAVPEVPDVGGVEVPDLDGLGELAEGAAGLAEGALEIAGGAVELLGGLLGAIGEIVGGL